MSRTSNPQIELAYDYICQTNKNIFLTGKAGTGKTTFLKRVHANVPKRVAVVAPTGIAAINAGGVTIHSLFQLPFGTLVPGYLKEQLRQRRFSRQKIKLIRSLDLLIIDEISMVRADVLDAIDEVLRRYRDYSRPFGGLQLLMIGDLHQLPPVVKQEEWEQLHLHYETPYFFGSKALKKTDAVTIELTHIYRQSDSQFIDLLNRVRGNHLDEATMQLLNSRFQPEFQPAEDEGYITLSSHNATAQQINAEKLDKIPGSIHQFTAEIEGSFPAHAYPTEPTLSFKVDAQVMFVKNDLQTERRYYNGKIGRITKIGKDKIHVQCPDDEDVIKVEIAEWRNIKYKLDEKTKEVTEEILGTFQQYPLKLAWAITIHKSQGLTFERVIIDAASAFAHGQVYVALSRCKSFEGIVLRTQIKPTSVKTDRVVKNFTKEAQQKQPNSEQLFQAKREYQQGLLFQLFSFKRAERYLADLERILLEQESAFQGNPIDHFRNLQQEIQEKVISLAQKFVPHLNNYFRQPGLPEHNQELIGRLKKASTYFCQQLKTDLLKQIREFTLLTDNKAVRQKAKDKLDEIHKELFIKNACFECCLDRFDAQSFIEARSTAELDVEQIQKTTPRRFQLPKNIPNQELYKQLSQWRSDMAAAEATERYAILPNRSLFEIVQVLPTNLTSLKRINGIGKQRAEKYAADLIELINDYCIQQGLPTDQLQFSSKATKKEPKPPKVNTKAISYDLYRNGKSISEIAKERNLVTGTIESHLTHYIQIGELDIFELIPREKVDIISKVLQNNDFSGFGEAKAKLGDACTFGELRMVSKYLEQSTKNKPSNNG